MAEQAPAPAPAASAPAPVRAAPAPGKDATTRGVESILEEDLGDTYMKMSPGLQAKFRKEGERVTAKIVAMVKSARLKSREVLALISGWLKMIPGANRFFLIQEAKIKTDKLVLLAEEEKRKRATP